MDYREFIKSKARVSQAMGFEPDESLIPKSLFDWQKEIVRWCCRRGRAAVFAECGLGKTAMQLSWAQQVATKTQRPVMLHCPLGVRMQTLHEARKFGISVDVRVIDDADELVNGPSIAICNYDKLHKFKGVMNDLGGVVLDESSILKNFTGAIKRSLIESYRDCPYRLACTATPAPNDHMELGNHAEFLGVMPSNEMLSRWFINDTMRAGGYRLINHAVKDFWHWVSSWAVCITKPSDIGPYDDSRYILPELRRNVINVDFEEKPADGHLFPSAIVNATTVHSVKRQSTEARARAVGEIVEERGGQWVVWCDTDYEADALVNELKQWTGGFICEVRGSMSSGIKEDILSAFSDGKYDLMISKPGLAGFGLNWQHVHQVRLLGCRIHSSNTTKQ